MLQMLSQAGPVALLSLIVAVVPLGFGVAYAVRPTELRLALLRPISLAGIFAGLSGSLSGAINVLQLIWAAESQVDTKVLAVGSAEAIVPLFVAFGSLTIAWLCSTVGLSRHQ